MIREQVGQGCVRRIRLAKPGKVSVNHWICFYDLLCWLHVRSQANARLAVCGSDPGIQGVTTLQGATLSHLRGK